MNNHIRRRAGKHRRSWLIRCAVERLENRMVLTAPGLVFVNPAENVHTAALDTVILATYDQAISPASASSQTLAAHATLTGQLTESAAEFLVNGATVSLDPIKPLKPGELVRVTATREIANLAGESTVAPFVWEFRTEAQGGTGYFVDGGQALGEANSNDVAIGDFDGDGDLDAVTANSGWPNYADQVWLNDGSGQFSRGQSLSSPGAEAVASGDLDGDGDLDIVVSDSGGATGLCQVWLNDGAAHFSLIQTFQARDSRDIALGDFDGDGDLDAALAAYEGSDQIWLNDGSGQFSNSGQDLGSSESGISAVAVGDLDTDGDLDVFITQSLGQRDQVWINDGNGHFNDSGQRIGSTHSQGCAVDLGDLDGDGDLDAFVANCWGGADGGEVWLNDGDGQFNLGQRLETEGGSPPPTYSDVALADFDRDGDLDAVICNEYGTDQVWFNDGHARFNQSLQNVQASSGGTSEGVAVGDLDGDGDLDAFFAIGSWAPNRIWLNSNGSTDLTISVTDGQVSTAAASPLIYTITAVNNGPSDGVNATVLSHFASQLDNVLWTATASEGVIFTPQGAGDIHDAVTVPVGGQVVYTATANVRPDATGSIITRAAITSEAEIYEETPEDNSAYDMDFIMMSVGGSGVFDDLGQRIDNQDSTALALGDLDGDGDLDGVFTSSVALPTVWLNQGYGNFVLSDKQPDVWGSDQVALSDLDADGDLDAVFSIDSWGWLAIGLNDGSGAFSPSGQLIEGDGSGTPLIGDLDGDTDFDLLMLDRTGFHSAYLNNGNAEFVNAWNAGEDLQEPTPDVTSGALGDLDNDGDLDVFIVGDGTPNQIWWNTGIGTFRKGEQLLGVSHSQAVALGDVDADGDLDAFVGNDGESNRVWLNNGEGQFYDSGQLLGSFKAVDVALVDLDGDGDLDAFVANDYGPNRVWLNDGRGNFADSGQSLGWAESRDLALGDLDGDGDIDAVVANQDAPDEIWFNLGGSSVLPNKTIRGRAWEDLDGDGIQDASEPGLAGVAVNLFAGATRSFIRTTTTTMTNGEYAFDALWPGDYSLQFAIPEGVSLSPFHQGNAGDLLDSDANPRTGRTPVFTVSPDNESPAVLDVGLMGSVSATLQGRAWGDFNGDGLQQPHEAGMPRVGVTLLTGEHLVIGSATTNEDGTYEFDRLAPGSYRLSFEATANSTFSPMKQGEDDRHDSDANRSTGLSERISLMAGQRDDTRDVGLYAGHFSENVGENLRITELMVALSPYYPEFIELKNIGSEPLDLRGVRFVDGVGFDFSSSNITSLFPGEHVVLVADAEQFSNSYDASKISIAGEYLGNLARNGERIEMVAPVNRVVQEFTYAPDWFAITEAYFGFSLTASNDHADPLAWGTRTLWRPSTYQGGSPGADDPRLLPDPGSVVINEVMSNPADGFNDWIELHNTTNDDIDIGGWYLADDKNGKPRFQSYQIPQHTILPADGYLVFTRAGDFRFGLSSFGETLQLTAGDAQGNLLGYSESVRFGASEIDVTFGRSGSDFVALKEPTMNMANAAPRISWVVINEIMYQPGFLRDEFIELYNRTAEPVDVSGWTLRAISQDDGRDYQLPAGTIIPSDGYLLVVPIDPDTFRTMYGISDDTLIVGPFSGRLDNAGEDIQLFRQVSDRMVLVDNVDYENDLPWPAEARQGGGSLERIHAGRLGNDASNWSVTRTFGGTPGKQNSVVTRERGDFDQDGRLDVDDLDLLTVEVREGRHLPYFDLTDDDRVDQHDREEWIVNVLGSCYGDANLDGSFNSSDFVQVFQIGRYEDEIEGNATWSSGDWSGDGEFDTADLVLAFQTGLYEVKSGLNVGKIAAAVDWLFTQDNAKKTSRAFVA